MIWIPPLVTVWLFAFSAVCGQKTTELMDPMWANLVRLLLASVMLALMAWWLFDIHWYNAALPWFLLSGAIGFGIGDIGLFFAYDRIGSRLTLLIYLCLAPPFAACGEWWWLHTPLTLRECLGIAVILTGVALAVGSGRRSRQRSRRYGSGLFFAVIAGLGQGLGGVVSRYADMRASPESIPAMTQAFQRCLGGLAVVIVATLVLYPAQHRSGQPILRAPESIKRVWPWMLGAVFLGPVIGVTFFQWSLRLIGNSALLQAVVATTPIAAIPLAYYFEKDIPTMASVVGACIAVAGVVVCVYA